MGGLESNMSLQNMNANETIHDLAMFTVIECVFLTIYSMELVLRFAAYGCRVFRSYLVIFDLMLVIGGWLSVIFKDSSFGPILMLRILRLLRLGRAFRLVSRLKILWAIVSGLLQSVGTLLSTGLLLTLSLYVAACFAIEIISKDTELRMERIRKTSLTTILVHLTA